MKNKMLCLLAVLLVVFTAGCAGSASGTGAGEMTPEAIAEKLCDGVDVPPHETVPLDASNFPYFAFIPYDDSLSAAAADALVNITPHSVVVIRAADGNGAELAKQIAAHADPNKWLCVGAETVRVAYTDHYVVLVMSEKATAEAITANFAAMAEELDGMETSVLTASNSRYEP